MADHANKDKMGFFRHANPQAPRVGQKYWSLFFYPSIILQSSSPGWGRLRVREDNSRDPLHPLQPSGVNNQGATTAIVCLSVLLKPV